MFDLRISKIQLRLLATILVIVVAINKDGLQAKIPSQVLPTITITFNSLSNDDGRIMILVKNQDNIDVAKLVVPIYYKRSSVKIEVPQGKYAVVAYHDINGNEDLDKNAFGIPTEPYGFSNNARGLMGEPDLEDQLVDVLKDTIITFELK